MLTGQTIEIVFEIISILGLLVGIPLWIGNTIAKGDDAVRDDLRRDLDEHRATHKAFAEKIETEVDAVRASCATREDIGRLYDAVADVRQDVKQLVDHALGGGHTTRTRRRDDSRP